MFPIVFRRISVIMLVVVSLSFSAYNIFSLFQNGNFQSKATDYVSNWERRMQPVKRKLPAGTANVGYVADEDLRTVWAPTNGEMVEFDLTRYALIPLVVQHGVKYPWIIGNFSSKNFENWLTSSIGAYQIEDLGSGIYLIHRAAK